MLHNVHLNHPDLVKANILLGRIEFIRDNLIESKRYLDLVNPFYSTNEAKILEASLYTSDYLFNYLELSDQQRRLLVELRNNYSISEAHYKQENLLLSKDLLVDFDIFYFELLNILDRDQGILLLKDKLNSFYSFRVRYGWAPMMGRKELTEKQKENLVVLLTEYGSVWSYDRIKGKRR